MYGKIRIEQVKQLKPMPKADEKLGFGRYFTDHMLLMDYEEGKGWFDPRIVPYAPLTLDPAAMVFHYGQAVFEGLKAFQSEEGEVRIFRPDQNAKRLNHSNERLQMPFIDEDFFVASIQTLVHVDAKWVPQQPGSSLYIRPFIVATEAGLGVRSSARYLFVVILTPVDSYYEEGLQPIHILVESHYARAAQGGIGDAKTGGNYAASMKAQALAKQKNCAQVLWLDASEKKFLEEVGSMNVFFYIGGEVITPSLSGSILAGVTRNSIIQLLKDWKIPVIERKISIAEIVQAYEDGTLQEAFGTGTAAVVSPIGSLHWNEKQMVVHQGGIGELTQRLYNAITGIQRGTVVDSHGWMASR
ncbi:branched-chain amino acid aminotransferase [Paenibacillus sp. SYP-B3998]|uniref:Branched-chain-amino-acid aminotransferase n=1 Tax=Paenibacillus sp. SYP-B3998 TaxID=2678564 RepID=A0A6G4A0J1_9BACL|nr:branched-chain amino acid aminotransferase [Paenibacillus sp. SYP-B3998]NEW07983.1 branched-chain amino acid aminotransferase [Paenibacillus sp. SYP-B3998]